MIFIVIYLAVIIIVTVSAYWGAKSGKLPRFFKKYPQIPKILTFGYIIFAGCFVFPIRSNPFPLDFQKLYLLVLYYCIGSCQNLRSWQGAYGLHSNLFTYCDWNGMPLFVGIWRGVQCIQFYALQHYQLSCRCPGRNADCILLDCEEMEGTVRGCFRVISF